MKNALLLLSSLVLAFAGSVGLDRLVGHFQPQPTQSAGLIFPPNVKYRFRTPEFSSDVQTNSLGFRDREFTAEKTAKIRILAIGDSFTFGWGVEANQSWPKVLEAKLRTAGYDLEIANLGRPNGSPRDYAVIAEKAITLLKPDLIVVAVLQGDDLAQMAGAPPADGVVQLAEPADSGTAHPQLRRAMVSLYPHLLALADRFQQPQLVEQWKTDAARLLDSLSPAMKARFEKLDRGVQDALIHGELNPGLVFLGINQPDYFLATMDVNSPNVRPLILEMANQLGRVAAASRRGGAKAIVVSVPYGIYVSPSSYQSRHRLGFDVVSDMLTANGPDEAIRKASEIAGLAFHDVTGEFRQAALQRELFFELDGHFNAAGHERFATLLLPAIEMALQRDAR